MAPPAELDRLARGTAEVLNLPAEDASLTGILGPALGMTIPGGTLPGLSPGMTVLARPFPGPLEPGPGPGMTIPAGTLPRGVAGHPPPLASPTGFAGPVPVVTLTSGMLPVGLPGMLPIEDAGELVLSEETSAGPASDLSGPPGPELTRNSLTFQEMNLRPAFPGEVYTELRVRNPSLERTLVGSEVPKATPEEQPPEPAYAEESRAVFGGETVIFRSPRRLGPGIVVAMFCTIAVVAAGVLFLALKGEGRAPPQAPRRTAEVSAPPAGAAKAPPPAPAQGPARVRITTNLPATIRIDGTFYGNAPVELRDVPAEELRVEVSNPDLGFRKVALLTLEPGDNGTKEVVISRLLVELHAQPRAFITVDGRALGELESTKVELYEGWHKLQLVDRRGRKLSENFIVLPDQANRFSYSLAR